MGKVLRLYRCPHCGDTLTDAEYEEMMDNTGNGYCLCQFKDGERIFVGYDVYVLRGVKDES